MGVQRTYQIKVTKAVSPSETHEFGLVFGFLLVCTIEGEPYYDLDDHHIPDDVMFEAAVEYASSGREMKVMHQGDVVGEVLFMWPLTAEVAEAFALESSKTGLMIAMRPFTSEVFEQFESGELKGFSLAGTGWF